jgi:predicted pyridoxine 5'-phosphate oxidase superfamily flavin-nucleotide-binding protein
VTTAFNRDELAAQALAGGGPRGGAGIRDFMTDQHRLFFMQLPYVFVAAIDAEGWPVATILTGPPGFIDSPDPTRLRISALPPPEDPAHQALVPQRDIGVLGIDLSNRRRNRANGRILQRDEVGIDIGVAQSFGNCPQYIERRNVSRVDPAAARTHTGSNAVEVFDGLDAAARAAISGADTFFVASRSRPGQGAEYGADISHRGGPRGFVQVEGNRLTIPDFRGNRYFNTLGNLMADPRAALLFVRFESADLLQLQGSATVDWSGASAAQDGVERVWHFEVARSVRRRAAVPLRWSLRAPPESAPGPSA